MRKSFAEDEIVIAMGITMQGKKVLLGFVRTATENGSVCAAFLLATELRLHRIKGYRHLHLLPEAFQRETASTPPRHERVA